MQAIILAAGMGRRLREYTANNTKCMVEVNGVKLIDRLFDQLAPLGLKKAVVVVGYQAENLMSYLGKERKGLPIEYVRNDIYDRTNNIYSLALAEKQMQEDDTILIESDLIYDSGIFNLLIENPFPNLAIVAKYESWMDGTMVKIDEQNNIINFIPKSAFNFNEVGQYFKTLNIYKFSKEFAREKYVPFLDAYSIAVGNNEYYENVLSILSFLNSHDLKALPISGYKWYEIDDKQDLDIAEALFAEEKDLLRKYYGRFGGFWRFPNMLDFCYLVNPFFPTLRLLDEIRANFDTLLTGYPSGIKVNTLLASKCWAVREDYIIPGNGAAELIKALMEELSGKTGFIRPTFEEYPNRYSEEQRVCFYPSDKSFRYSAEDIIDFFTANSVDNIVLVNPDNPSGNYFPSDDVKKLAAWCEKTHTRLVLDESFVDFSSGYPSNTMLCDEILETFPGMVVVKSISKSYGVPGLRLGILASADLSLVSKMKQRIPIWNINSFAEFFMQVFSKYKKEYDNACAQFQTERARFESRLRSFEFLRVMPSEANYFLCEVLAPYTANEIVLTMLKRYNILTRDCSSKVGLVGRQYMRIAVRNPRDNDRLIAAFSEMHSQKNNPIQ